MLMIMKLIQQIIMITFANLNMANFPPPWTNLYSACTEIVQSQNNNDINGRGAAIFHNFLSKYALQDSHRSGECFDMSQFLPAGPNATISSGDWSGSGSRHSGMMWDYQVQ